MQLRESEDEQMIADIAASVLLNRPLPVDSERLDSLYERSSSHFQNLENSLAVYTPQKLIQNIVILLPSPTRRRAGGEVSQLQSGKISNSCEIKSCKSSLQ